MCKVLVIKNGKKALHDQMSLNLSINHKENMVDKTGSYENLTFLNPKG